MVTLESNQLFRALPPGELGRLAHAAREITVSPNQQVFKEGDPGDGMYIVKEGLIEISTAAGPQKQQVLSQVGPGHLFGEMALVDNQPRSASARACQASTLYFIPREDLLQLLAHSPELMLLLMREISHRLRDFNRQYLKDVLQSERLSIVGKFARSIIHDLKNPLNNIALTAQLAGMDQATPEIRKQAEANILNQVDRVNEMISEILEFTQGSAPDLVLASIQYGSFVEQLFRELKSEALLKGIAVELENPVPEARLLGNPKRLRRVFYNLAHNAGDALRSGGRIILRVRVAGDEIITEIEDDGPGIAPEIADQLFHPFVTHGKAHGTGLGLSICKRIIEDHKGWISARNGTERGAVFSFGLPKAPTPETYRPTPAHTRTTAP